MVRALLDGSKTQTRRALRPQPQGDADLAALPHRFGVPGERLWVRERFAAFGRWEIRRNAKKGRDEWAFVDMTCACGQRWRYLLDDPLGADPHATRDAAAPPAWHKRPALFMPRAASRILLEVVDVRVERLCGISPRDALAEGVLPPDGQGVCEDPVAAYRRVWEGINGAGSWEADPWVRVVQFTRIVRGSSVG
jgi:hypothetical protein